MNRKRVQRLMRLMDIEAIYPRPRTTESAAEHRKFPYLLRDREITKPDEVWAADITYIPMASGFMYLVAIIDWYSRYVLAWRLSNSLESSFCVEVLEEALSRRRPEIFNTDQGVQFTSRSVHGPVGGGGSEDQHGRERPGVGQRVHRAAVVEREVRARVPARSFDGAVAASRIGDVPEVLQSGTSPSEPGVHTPWDVYRGVEVVPGPMART